MKTLAIAFSFLLVSSLASAADSRASSTDKRPSPHGVAGQCQICHVEPEDVLSGWFTSGVRKRALVVDHNTLCRQCHGVAFGHGVEKEPETNDEGFPLAPDGTIACAITCHNMHIKAEDPVQNRYHLRAKQPTLCLSCHRK